jgi:hypothetical protein
MDIKKIRSDTPFSQIYFEHAAASIPPMQVIFALYWYQYAVRRR